MNDIKIETPVDELLPVMDSRQRTLYLEKRSIIHQQGLIHLAVHVMVFNSDGKILIQKRSAQKDTYPLYWDVSVGGHLSPGEACQQAAMRELKEELGIKGAKIEFLSKIKASRQTDWEHIYLYRTIYDGAISPTASEITEIRWISPEELSAQIHLKKLSATPALLYVLKIIFKK